MDLSETLYQQAGDGGPFSLPLPLPFSPAIKPHGRQTDVGGWGTMQIDPRETCVCAYIDGSHPLGIDPTLGWKGKASGPNKERRR